MDRYVGQGAFTEEHPRLDAEGTRLRHEIETSVRVLPKRVRFAQGRRRNNHVCVSDVLNLTERLYANSDPREDLSPAINHVMRATHTIAVRYKTGDPTLIMAMALHDSVEDHAEILARLGKRSGKNDRADALRFVRKKFGHSVGGLVEKVTHLKNPAGMSPEAKIATYTAYVTKISRDVRALVLKIADVRDNIFNPRPVENGGVYSMTKYATVLRILENGLTRHKSEIVKRWGTPTYVAIEQDIHEMKRVAKGFLAQTPTGD